jgi:assimilatory nitrate reductase catalytic subunit
MAGCPEGATSGQQRLYADGTFPTPDGRARFASVEPTARWPSRATARYPFSLNTGRLRDQWHGMSRTGTLGRLFGHVPEPGMQMHPQDMARRLLAPGDLVHLTSARGSHGGAGAGRRTVGLSQVFMCPCTGAANSWAAAPTPASGHGGHQCAHLAGRLPPPNSQSSSTRP